MIRGYLYSTDTGLVPLEEGLPPESLRNKPGCVTWIDVQDPTREEVEALARVYNLPAEAVDDCLEGEQRPRIDEYRDGELIFLVVYGALGESGERHFDPRKLAIFFTAEFVIAVHAEPLQTIDTIHRRCERKAKDLLGRGVHHLLFAILDEMVDNYGRLADGLDERVSDLEEESQEADISSDVLHRATMIRRELLDFRNMAVSQRELIMPFVKGDYGEVFPGLDSDLLHVRDHLTRVVEVIDNLRELLHGVRDNYNAVVANRMNEIMKTLTIFASLFLPMSLIAGLYGMNTPLWPDPESPYAFWRIVSAMGLVVLGMGAYFRWRRWL